MEYLKKKPIYFESWGILGSLIDPNNKRVLSACWFKDLLSSAHCWFKDLLCRTFRVPSMPVPCHFNISHVDLETFRAALQAATSSQPSLWTSWETCWLTVSDCLDQAEARAYEAGDVEGAKQVLRVNKLIQTCLHPNWDVVSQDMSPEKTILCSIYDWTDQWSRYKHGLGYFHMERFSDAAADLKRLQDNLTLLPAASWAHEAEKQVSLLLVDCWSLRQYRP